MPSEMNANGRLPRNTRQVLHKRGKNIGVNGSPHQATVTCANLTTGIIDADARRKMVADAAYYRSARRGFEPGYEVEDWLAAERDIDQHLNGEASSSS